MVKRLPAIQETQVQFLDQEDPLKKEMSIHSSTLAWKIPWTEEPDGLQSMGSQRAGHDRETSLFTLLTLKIISYSMTVFSMLKICILFPFPNIIQYY